MSFKETEVGRIPDKWNVDIIDNLKSDKRNAISMGPFGSRIKKNFFQDDGVPVIRGSNLKSFCFCEDRFVYLSDEKAMELKSSWVFRNDIVITHRGTLGQVGLIPSDSKYNKYIVSQSGMKLTCDVNKVNSKYLYYYLNSRIGQYHLLVNKSQVGVPAIARASSSLKKIPVPLPSLEEQRSIAHILSTIDKKIEINKKINKNLEEMAQTIFKEWFVDFNFPCLPENYHACNVVAQVNREKMEKVCTYRRVGGLPVPDGSSWFVYVLLCEDGSFYKGITTDLYRRFYEHYTGIGAEYTKVHKPVKVIHYEQHETNDQARKREEELKTGFGRKWLKREYEKSIKGLPSSIVKAGPMVDSSLGLIPIEWNVRDLHSIMEISSGKRPGKKRKTSNKEFNIPLVGASSVMGYVKEYNYNEPILVIGRVGTHGVVQRFNSKVWASDNTLVIKTIYYNFVNYILKSIDYTSLNRGSTQPLITQKDVKNSKIVMPSSKVLGLFEYLINENLRMILMNNAECFRLGAMRDSLLPKLMSGEIRVSL